MNLEVERSHFSLNPRFGEPLSMTDDDSHSRQHAKEEDRENSPSRRKHREYDAPSCRHNSDTTLAPSQSTIPNNIAVDDVTTAATTTKKRITVECNTPKEEDKNHPNNESLTDTADTSFGSTRSGHTALFIRDTSIDGGPGGGVETSRITVNTHNSILNITEEDDDEEGSEVPIEKSFLFEDDFCDMEDSSITAAAFEDHGSVHSADDPSAAQPPISSSQFNCIPQTPPTCRSSTWKSSWCETAPGSATASTSTPPTAAVTTTNHGGSGVEVAKKDASLLDFLDGLCSASTVPPPGGGAKPLKSQPDKDAALVWENYQRVLEYDIMELLGCASPPDQDEINRVWHFNLVPTSACTLPPTTNSTTMNPTPSWVGGASTSRKSRRRQWRERAMYVHRIRIDRSSSPSSVIPPPFAPNSRIPGPTKCRSMDDRLWSTHHDHYNAQSSAWNAFGLFATTTTTSSNHAKDAEPDDNKSTSRSTVRDMDPTLLFSEDGGDGYDSDPEDRTYWRELVATTTSEQTKNKPLLSYRPSSRCSHGSGSREESPSFPSRRSQQQQHHFIDPSFSSSSGIFDTVQETLNMSWTLTWYPRRSNDTIGDPRAVQAWIERGTLIEMNTVMLEPNLMWRETYQPELETKRRLNKSSQKPHYIRLLNLCRVLTSGVDRSRYPLVRPSCCVLIRTSDGQEHVFETKTRSERDELVRRWKFTTARFATLAVLEDLETICKEFFSPMVTSRMLVPDYSKLEEEVHDDDDDDDEGEEEVE